MEFKLDPTILPRVSYYGFVKLFENKHFYRKVNEYILYIICDGQMFLREGKEKYHLKEGDFFILEPNIEHEGFDFADVSFYYIHFIYPEMLIKHNHLNDKSKIINNRKATLISNSWDYEILGSELTFIPKHYHLQNAFILDKIKQLLNNAIDEYNLKLQNYKVVASLMLLNVFIEVHREYIDSNIGQRKNQIRKNSVINDVVKYINTNIDSKFNRSLFEEKFDFNYDYLNRLFKTYTGHTITKYINHQRINYAKTLMRTTSMKFNEIAYTVGIDDPYYFSKLFKKYAGLTPSDYLKNISISE